MDCRRPGPTRRSDPLRLNDAAALALSIAAISAALTLWNIGSRPPGQALAALFSLPGPRALAPLMLRLLLGFVAVLAGTLAVLEVAPSSDPYLVPVSLLVFLSAILVEHLVGAEIRARLPMLFGGREQRHG